MRKLAFIMFLLVSLSAQSQIVNRFRDSSWFKAGVRFDSTLVFSKGAGSGKVWTSNASGTGSWQTFTSSGVTQSALDDSILSVRGIRKVDTLYKNAASDSIVFLINGIRYSVLDKDNNTSTFSFTKNATKDSIIATHDGVRSAVKDSIANLTGYALQTSLNDTANVLRGLIPNVSSYATITNLKDSTALVRGLIPDVSGLATKTALADTSTLLRGLISSRALQTSLNDTSSTLRTLIGTKASTQNLADTSSVLRGLITSSIPTFSLSKNTTRDSIVTVYNGSRSAVKDSSIVTPTLSYGFGVTRDTMVINYNGVRTALRDSTGGGASLSGLTAATATNTINNANYGQEWQWNSLTSGTGLKLSSSSTVATNGNTVLEIANSGTIGASQSTYGAKISNSKVSSSGTNYGLDINVGGSSANIGLNINTSSGTVRTGINLVAGMTEGIQMNGNSLYISGGTRYIGSASGELAFVNNAPVKVATSDLNPFYCSVGISNSTGRFNIARPTITTHALVFGGDCNGANSYRSELTSYSIIKAGGGTLTFCGATGVAGSYGTITPVDIMSVYGTNANVGVGTTTPVVSAALEISSTTKGFLPPRMTSTQASAISSPAKSLMLYVTDTNGTFTSAGWWGYNGTIWKLILAE